MTDQPACIVFFEEKVKTVRETEDIARYTQIMAEEPATMQV